MSNDTLETRRTLVSRLRDLDDQESWRVFFDRYWELFYNVARQSGLSEEDARDIVQETVIGVAKAIPEFRYDPTLGSFKQWLLRITRRRITDQFRRLYRQPAMAAIGPEALAEAEERALEIKDPAAEKLEAVFDEEWERGVLAEAIRRVKQTANPKHFQVFDYCVVKEWPASKVAATLEIGAAQVHLARHRVSQAVKKAARVVQTEWASGDGISLRV